MTVPDFQSLEVHFCSNGMNLTEKKQKNIVQKCQDMKENHNKL